MATPQQIQDFIASITPFAQKYGAQYGIDPAVIVSQAALESGYGTAAPNNNYFGVKGKGASLPTKEQGASGLVPTTSSFRTYPSMDASVADYAHLIGATPRYANVSQTSTPQDAFSALKADGYASDASYVPKLLDTLNVLRKNGFDPGTQVAQAPSPVPLAPLPPPQQIASAAPIPSIVPPPPPAAAAPPDIGADIQQRLASLGQNPIGALGSLGKAAASAFAPPQQAQQQPAGPPPLTVVPIMPQAPGAMPQSIVPQAPQNPADALTAYLNQLASSSGAGIIPRGLSTA